MDIEDKLEKYNDLVTEQAKWIDNLLQNIKIIVIKLVIIVAIYYLFNMFVNHMTFWEATNWVGAAAASASASGDPNRILEFLLAILGLYSLASIILDVIINPSATIVTTYTDGSRSYSHGFLRKLMLWILGIVGSIVAAGFVGDQVLKPICPIDGNILIVLVALFWILFFLGRDIFRIVRASIQIYQYKKIIRIANNNLHNDENVVCEDDGKNISSTSSSDVTPIKPNLSANNDSDIENNSTDNKDSHIADNFK